MTKAEIHTIPVGITNCYLIKQKGTILIDTGVPDNAGKILKYLEKSEIKKEDIRLIIHTHGHWDHIGNTSLLAKETGAKIAIHKTEKECIEKGTLLIPPGVTRWGRFLGHFSRMISGRVKLKTTKVDIVVDDQGLDLSQYGVDCKVVFTPGHSYGSVSIVLNTGEAFVGDMAMNGFPFRRGAGLPIFAEDLELLKKSWNKLLEMDIKTVYPAHGKSIDASVMAK